MDFRMIKAEALPQVKELWNYCFEKKDTFFFKWYFSQYCPAQNQIMGGFNKKNQLQTMLHLNPYNVKVGAQTIKTQYIVGVATDPVARGQHIMGDLLRTAFTVLRASGFTFVILMPINAGIYLPYGFAYTHLKKAYKLPLRALNLAYIDSGLLVERVEPLAVVTALAAVYLKVMQIYNGYVVRSLKDWQNILTVLKGENGEVVLVKEKETVVGYALYNKDNTTLRVQELLAVNAAVKRRLLAYFKSFAGTFI